jgi:hypothetical protein
METQRRWLDSGVFTAIMVGRRGMIGHKVTSRSQSGVGKAADTLISHIQWRPRSSRWPVHVLNAIEPPDSVI